MTLELFILIAILLDLIFGDPRWYPHPVRLIGALATALERFWRKIFTNARTAGVFTVFFVLLISCGSIVLLLWLASVAIWLQTVLAVLLLYSLIAVRDLLRHSKEVYASLYPVQNIEEARKRVGCIVGRDTQGLDGGQVVRACVETVAENMVDGITAPLFWALVGSVFAPWTPLSAVAMAAVGMLAYKCINTMDSMFGYKNERYLNFGWASARLDDLVNMLPARLSGAMIVLAAYVLGMDGRGSFRIYRRDRGNHASPNAGHPEAAIAGALQVKLGGPSSYFGGIVEKPTIGDADKELHPRHILQTQSLILAGSALFLFLGFLLRNICIWLALILWC